MNASPALSTPSLELRTHRARQLMECFAERTGVCEGGSLAPEAKRARRYLWTDAFAVCNFLSLAEATGDERYAELAGQLVTAVHGTLGRHRPDDWRAGWLSGLSDRGASTHPTWGGLRIGKPLPERKWDDALDEQLEWERDGQYFHYLTKWMHALDQLARHTRQPRYNLWARELAAVAFAAFSVQPSRTAPRRLVWKMSIDLSRPLIDSMGQHDALEGLVTCVQLQSTASALHVSVEGPSLTEERNGFETMAAGAGWATTDPLGLGELLTDAYRIAQLQLEGARFDGDLMSTLLSAALEGLAHFADQNGLARPAGSRLAFRELGLSVGLHALERLGRLNPQRGRGPHARASREEARLLEALSPAIPLGPQIDAYWLKPEHREASAWAEHLELNEVALATSLCPVGFLELPPVT